MFCCNLGGKAKRFSDGVLQMDFDKIRSHVMVFIATGMTAGAKDPGNKRIGTSAFQRMSEHRKRFSISEVTII